MFVDGALARRIERCEGAIGAAIVDARARLQPETGACWTAVGGTWAMFDGEGSPMTQTFGLGLFEPADPTVLDALEAFFAARGASTLHEVSPLAGVATAALLVERGYRPVEHTAVLVRALGEVFSGRGLAPPLRVGFATPDQGAEWAACSARGWAVDGESAPMFEAFAGMAFASGAMTSVYVAHEGEMIATGSLGMHEGVALLGGASTVPEQRGRGAQGALLAARLERARSTGCDMAIMGAEPGSTSQRNAERSGFRVAYTRTKWARQSNMPPDTSIR